MMDVRELLQQMMEDGDLEGTLSNSRDKEYGEKVKIRPVLMKDELKMQAARYTKTQVFHENLSPQEMVDHLERLLRDHFKQGEFTSRTKTGLVLVSQKGKTTVKCKNRKAEPREIGNTEPSKNYAHNREKQYILQEGTPVDFLVGLGVQSKDGYITKNRYDKFRQINRYLEYIEDILDRLPQEGTIRIIDFGCGKSYLTFAMYYYLKVLQNRDLEVLGLDLKKDVIAHCNELAKACGYEHLHFQVGDIKAFDGWDRVDMVVSLHACDTATDYAIEKAVKWGAKVIMAVPCCQHELNKQIHCDALEPVLQYGLIKERMAALITDALRAQELEKQGYDTQILEFIDMEHTPKNLLIRAVKGENGKMRKKKKDSTIQEKELEELIQFLEVNPTLHRILP